MVVSIMSPCCRAALASLVFLIGFLHVFIKGEVFQRPVAAHSVLRSKRANMFLLEELLQGNLERECYEEMCNYEEAREYFEDNKKTLSFWTVYYDGDQCLPNPCRHGGNCTDMFGGFACSCTPPYHGPLCELGALVETEKPEATSAPKNNIEDWARVISEVYECPTEGPEACHQLCTASYRSFTCSCMPGFKLQSDNRSCLPEVEFPCGRLPHKFNSTTLPWQVSLMDRKGVELCKGVVLGRRSVLTSARCLLASDMQPSNLYVLTGNKKVAIAVQALYNHKRFHRDQHNDDLTLLELASPLPFGPTLIHLCLPTKDFSENILMHAGRTGLTERLNHNQKLVYMTLDECRSKLNVSHPLNNKMFCMKSQTGAGRRQNGPRGNQNEIQGRQNGSAGIQNGTHRSLNGDKGDQNQTQTHRSQNGAHGTPNGAVSRRVSTIENHKFSESDDTLRSKVSRRRINCGLLPGTPVATVEKETAFLTGLLTSSSAGCHSDGDSNGSSDGNGGGAVFTKLSRYLVWIKMRLEATENHMTPQVLQYPENR